ncbi:MAG TPA: bifunctional diaminohydroxyphosphoribosylaminopyrimidine deaminase/5-amino-6-(5-phosphoribosylamino)uracil reductase RibD [Gemmatimonadaceae bacterium]|nr:bifunctional diaminohydroxyphosphoribosylaminopyrimidine deaminase/5-amino-6-(5-phosphoribosylamino)uracil reductase RibD [Gemmatimonadaceae bacterium]
MNEAAGRADKEFMRHALALAERGWGQTAPNPMVGAVVVLEGRVAGEGFHARFGEAHAEIVALREAGAAAKGATLYVSLEPCAHHGKTPPCADAIIRAGVSRVVAAVGDPSRVARGGMEKLRAAGVSAHLSPAEERDAAVELNAAFFHAQTSNRPWATLKLALSADDRIADPSRERRWITGEAARAEVHRLRANSDAIAVGIGTVLADDPALTVRGVPAPRVAPRRVVFDSQARIPVESTLVRTARETPTIVIARPGADRKAVSALATHGVQVAAEPDLDAALVALRAAGVRSLFLEGGARLAGAFLAQSLVDRLIIFRSRRIVGHGPGAFDFAPAGFAASLARTRVVDERPFGDDIMTIYALHEVECSPA